MLNAKKLLYILPDVAYIAELLPTKKEHVFAVQTFRQINGEFVDDNELIADNITKLFKKIDPDDYHVILPDFLCTTTIVEVAETSDAKIKTHLKEQLLPSLGLTKEEYQLKTTILTEHGGKSKIQLSALEKSLVTPIAQQAAAQKVTITGISPLSWTIKSIISLEPSISIIQMGSRVYLAQHYIGVDQTNSSSIEEIDTLAETIKTLKGAEPSIQTMYLLTNPLVEEKLKELLSDTLPLQQLTKQTDQESEMPNYVRDVIEAGMKTLSIKEYPVPSFPLDKSEAPATTSETTDKEAMPNSSSTTLPKPTAAPVTTEVVEEDENSTATTSDAGTNDQAESETSVTTDKATPEASTDSTDDKSSTDSTTATEDSTDTSAAIASITPTAATTTAAAVPATTTNPTTTEPTEADANVTPITDSSTQVAAPATTPTQPQPQQSQPIQSAAAANLHKRRPDKKLARMIFVSIAVFFATVGIGIGLGLGVINFLKSQSPEQTSPVASPIASAEPSPSPSPSPSPEPSVEPADASILVVNATTRAGYAGTVKSDLDDAGFGTVEAGNAQGEYEEGNFVLMTEEDQALIDLLEDATELELEFSDEVTVEDTQGEYDAIVVLAE